MESSGSFPPYFNLLYELFLKIHWDGETPDDRVRIISENFGEILSNMTDEVAGDSDLRLTTFFASTLTDNYINESGKQLVLKSGPFAPSAKANADGPQPSNQKATSSFLSTVGEEKRTLKQLSEECSSLISFLEKHNEGDTSIYQEALNSATPTSSSLLSSLDGEIKIIIIQSNAH